MNLINFSSQPQDPLSGSFFDTQNLKKETKKYVN